MLNNTNKKLTPRGKNNCISAVDSNIIKCLPCTSAKSNSRAISQPSHPTDQSYGHVDVARIDGTESKMTDGRDCVKFELEFLQL